MGREKVLPPAFTRARDYKRSWDDYRARDAKGDKTAIAFFSSRRRHTILQGDWSFRRVLFRSSPPTTRATQFDPGHRLHRCDIWRSPRSAPTRFAYWRA